MSQQGILVDKTTAAPDIETLTGDSGGAVGADGANNVNIVGGDTTTISGNPGTNTLTVDTSSSGYPISPFVVGVSGEAGYTTIQSALDAANTAGGGTVYIQPATYSENLTLYDQVDLVAASGGGSIIPSVKIIGSHVPPTSGDFTIKDVFLESATDIFNSAMAASTNINLIGGAIKVVDGFTFNLPNWTGKLLASNLLEVQSTDDGWLNNSGGAIMVAKNMTVGRGTTRTMVTSGLTELVNCVVDCPVDFQTGTGTVINSGTFFQKTVTYSGDSSGEAANSIFAPSTPTAAIIYNTTGTLTITSCGINSANNPAISGTGSGTLTITGVDFIRNNTIDVALTRDGGESQSGSFHTVNEPAHFTIVDNNISGLGTDANVNVNLIPKGSGVVASTTQIQAPSISFDSGTNSLADYEEGTWTPVLNFVGGSTGITYANQNGQYTRIGNVVFLQCAIELTSKGTDTGGAQITGIPFANSASFRGIFNVEWSNISFTANYTEVSTNLPNSSSTISLTQLGDGVAIINLADTGMVDTSIIRFTGNYCV